MVASELDYAGFHFSLICVVYNPVGGGGRGPLASCLLSALSRERRRTVEGPSAFSARARMVKLVDTRDLKSRGAARLRAGSTPAPGTKSDNEFV